MWCGGLLEVLWFTHGSQGWSLGSIMNLKWLNMGTHRKDKDALAWF